MKNNRLISAILCFVFVFTSLITVFPVFSASASTVVLYEDDYSNAFNVLNEICPGIPLGNGDSITRIDFVAAVTMLLGKTPETNVPTGFTDVGADHKYSGNIKYAKDLGLISSSETFAPDAPISYAQALKVLMCATGHGQKADYMGGYPTGYIKAAKDAGVGAYIDLSPDANISSKEATELVFEAACTDILDITGFGDSFEYSETEGKNLLSVMHKIYIAEGVVTANKTTGLYSVSSNMNADGITINGKEYYGEGYTNLIGKNVRVFFKGEKKREIIKAYPVENKVYSFVHKDSIKISGNSIEVLCDGTDKEEKISLSKEYTVIFNGKYYAASESSYNAAVNPKAGMVEITDNNADGKADVISVKSIEYGVVDTINKYEGKIYDKYKANGMITVSDDIDYTIADYEGEALSLTDLTPNTVVGYARSKDGKAIEIIRFSSKIGGTYSELTDDNVMYLGQDKEVELSDYFVENVKDISAIKRGTQIIAYLGIGNQVVYIEEYANSISYGYLSGFKADYGTGLNASPYVRIYSQDGEMNEYKLAEKLSYNGKSVTRSEASNLLASLMEQHNILRVIKFAVNANGELSKVYETVQNTEGAVSIIGTTSAEASPVLFDTNLDMASPLRELEFKYNIFFPYFSLRTGAPIMQVPLLKEDESDKTNYRVYSLSELSSRSSNEQYGYFYGYDVTKDGAGFILWISEESGGVGKVDEFTLSGVVESVTDGTDAEGNPVKVVRTYIDKTWKKLYSPSEYTEAQASLKTTIETIKPGDIVRFETDSKNVISACRIDFSYANGKAFYQEGTSSKHAQPESGGKYIGFAFGYIYALGGGKATIIRNKTIDEIESETNSGTLSSQNMYPVNISSGTTVFVDIKRDRNNPDKILSADIYTEPDLSTVESYFSAGREADYVVSRARLHAISINVIYVN